MLKYFNKIYRYPIINQTKLQKCFGSFNSQEKLIKIRGNFEKYDINSYFLPNNDEHHSEYLAERDKKIKKISGFSGSNAHVFISNEEALLWTDSRYFIQAKKEIQEGWTFKEISPNEKKWYEYVQEKYSGSVFKIGVDPNLISANEFELREEEFKKYGIELKSIKGNLVDCEEIMANKEIDKIFIHDKIYSGLTIKEKYSNLKEKTLQTNKHIKFLLTSELDEIAWILNLRGNDIPYNPVFKSFLLLDFNENALFLGTLYINKEKVNDLVFEYIKNSNLQMKSYEEINEDLKKIEQNIIINKNSLNYSIYKSIPSNFIVKEKWPLKPLKAIKNPTEINGYISSHLRDGLSLIRFLTWLNNQIKVLKRNDLTEFEAARKIDEIRSKNELFVGLSFKTISSSGANSAIVHYSAEENNTSFINKDSIYLLDSGGHYLDGTTDITRTMHMGNATKEEKNAYTLVLSGNLNLERVIWPSNKEVSGANLDILARISLWKQGMDFGHGTGHGVGYFLNVHEGPHSISRKSYETLQENMIVTNEPGYYLEGSYGIRIENCLVIQKAEIEGFLKFRNLTMVPYDKNLIETSLLSIEDIKFINAYHKKIFDYYLPILEKNNEIEEKVWLEEATQEIK